jgi:hypothetical protein
MEAYIQRRKYFTQLRKHSNTLIVYELIVSALSLEEFLENGS